MAHSAYARNSFAGGEWSKTAQGRFDQPAYATSLNVCLNALPTEQSAWSRRSGTAFAQTTRGGLPGRVIAFPVNESNPYVLEFTDVFLRIFSASAAAIGGWGLVTTNDAQQVVSISSANPAVVQTAAPYGWGDGNYIFFPNINMPRLQNRVFTLQFVDSTHFKLLDGITNAPIDGSTLGAFTSGTVAHPLQLSTSYIHGSWSNIVSVQAETQAVLLNGSAPQVLTMTNPPVQGSDATFSLLPANFIDGPYRDPIVGSIVTYNAQIGNITLTFSFLPWSSTTSYNLGDYVVSGGQGYQSLQNANLNNVPPNATFWKPVNGGAPVGPNGFTSADIGRHIRLFSEPQTWSSSANYNAQTVVKYNNAYWQALINNSNVIPGTSATTWVPVTGINYALWTWGRIISVSGIGLITPGISIGAMTAGGGLAAAFNGVVSQTFASSAQSGSAAFPAYQNFAVNTPYSAGTFVYGGNGFNYQCLHTFSIYTGPPQTLSAGQYYLGVGSGAGSVQGLYFLWNGSSGATVLGAQGIGNTNMWTNVGAAPNAVVDTYVGQNFSASPKAIQQGTLFPSNDLGFANNIFTTLVINLRAKATAPTSPSDGTVLGTTTLTANQTASVTIRSSNTTSTWSYVWFELVATQNGPLPFNGTNSFSIALAVGQAEFFAPNVNNGSVITLQLAGPALLYAPGTVVNTWRAGLYSNSAGWPICGCYVSEGGRLWLGGAVKNRADASQSNNIFVFSPTNPDGSVSDNNAISAVFNAKKVNTVFWMEPDAQGVLVGTDGGEFLISALTPGTAITPTNINVNPVTQAKCAQIEPVRSDHTLLVVQRQGRKILEYFADVFSGKFSAPNLMVNARHLTTNFIKEIRYQNEITPTVWARCGDGSWFGITYKRDTLMTSQGPTYAGAHRHALGSGRVVESITVGPSQGGTLDALVMVTNDPTTGIRHVEVLTDLFEETESMQNAWFLDDAVTPTSYTIGSSNVVFNGLWHLNGKTVTVFAAGLDCGDFAVSNGSVTVPYGDGISEGAGGGLFTQALANSFPSGALPAVIGFTYNSDGQLTRPMSQAESGARNGPALAKKRRFDQYGALIVTAIGGVMPETTTPAGLQFGTDFNHLKPATFRLADDTTKLPFGTAFSGVHWDTIDDDAGFDGMVCWRIGRPWPAILAAIQPFGASQDK